MQLPRLRYPRNLSTITFFSLDSVKSSVSISNSTGRVKLESSDHLWKVRKTNWSVRIMVKRSLVKALWEKNELLKNDKFLWWNVAKAFEKDVFECSHSW
jgi:hypothetical protein